MTELKSGTQVYYIPNRAHHDISHPDVEQGFVIKDEGNGRVWVCYFHKRDPTVLRTTANGELTPIFTLRVKNHRDQGEIDALMKELEQQR